MQWCAHACDLFSSDYRENIVEAFRRCGMGGKCDGTEDSFIQIEGFNQKIVL